MAAIVGEKQPSSCCEKKKKKKKENMLVKYKVELGSESELSK